MKGLIFEVLLLGAVFLAFIVLHEGGHYAAAAYFDLDPSFVLGDATADNLMNGLIGVQHQKGYGLEGQVIILSALIPPLGLGGAMRLSRREILQTAGMVFLFLAVAALIPLPGSDMANLLSLLG